MGGGSWSEEMEPEKDGVEARAEKWCLSEPHSILIRSPKHTFVTTQIHPSHPPFILSPWPRPLVRNKAFLQVSFRKAPVTRGNTSDL
jgi:hypothetical protein